MLSKQPVLQSSAPCSGCDMAFRSLMMRHGRSVFESLPGPKLLLIGCLVAGALLRFWYADGLPLNGDEVGVGVLQASGQAIIYADRVGRRILSLSEVRNFIEYNPDFSPKEVIHSLRFAGMHPPLYYLIVHYMLRFVGNDVLVLRALSIIFSLGAIIALYYLGRSLGGEVVGIYAAILLSTAPYGLVYGSLVRPYSMAMLLSILSTALAVRVGRNAELTFRDRSFQLYLVIAGLGIYTLYQFFFVFACHLIYLTLRFRHKKHRLNLILSACIVTGCFIPWLPSLLTHLANIRDHQYYFHQDFDFYQFATQIFNANLAPLFAAWTLPATLIGLILATTLSIGIVTMCRGRETRPFAAAFAIYFLLYYGVERIFHMSTLSVTKFLFFGIPIAFVMISAGVLRALNNGVIRNAIMSLGAGLLLVNSAVISAGVVTASEHEEESYVRGFVPELNSDPMPKLIIMNTLQRRYLFPFVHALHCPADICVIGDGGVTIRNQQLLDRYSRLYLVNLYVDYEAETFLTKEKLEAVLEILTPLDFRRIKSIVLESGPQKHSLVIFDKMEGPLKAD